MSASVILQTKLTPSPVRADRIHRPRLAQRFSTSLEHPLTLVCAPAGYGKSTLLAEWFGSDAGGAVAFGWLSLDEDDNDPVRFLTYLISAFANASGIDADEMLSLLHSPQPPPPKPILTALISRLEGFPGHLALVLDDYHRITVQPIHEAMTYLLDHLPAPMRLVITSREDPPFPLARFRGRGQLAEIRADDLRFTPDEAGQFLRQMLGVELSASQLRDLDARTEGWIAGLQLAALAMRGRKDIDQFITAFTGSHRYVLDFLTDEVLSQQPEPTRRFLLQTSVLDRLNGPLCEAVTGRSDGQLLLEQIERNNLFLIPLDDERYWYRYHHLFRDMLRRNLHQANLDSVGGLHLRASMWFEQNGYVGEAIEHALLGEDHDHAAGLIEQRYDQGWMTDGVQRFLRWMQTIPDHIWQNYPGLEMKYAFLLIAADVHSEAERHLLRVENQLARDDFADNSENKTIIAFAAIVRTTLAFYLEHDADSIIAVGMNALSLLPESESRSRAWLMIVIGCTYYASKGQIVEAESWFELAMQLIDKTTSPGSLEAALQHLTRLYMVKGQPGKAYSSAKSLLQRTDQIVYRGVAQLELSKLYYERNELDKALLHAMEGWEGVKEYALIRLTLDGYILLARHKHLQGAEAEARNLMQQAVDIVQKNDLKQTFVPVRAWQAWLWLVQGDVMAAARWAEKIEPTIHGDLNPALEFEHMILARIQIAQGRLDDAQKLLERLLESARDGGRMGRLISLSVLQALVAKMQGNIRAALDALHNALTLAEPEGYVRTFVDEGAPMKELLREAQARGISTMYVTKLLSTFTLETPTTIATPPKRLLDGEFEPLSERELEVLSLIADGLSNREIAERLVVSVGTVKKHLNNIFLKLDAHSRTQVIASARKYNLL